MKRRLQMLERLLDVYETVEELREAEAQRAAGEVREAELAIGRQTSLVHEAAGEERQALSKGDRMGWSYAMARQRVAGVRRKALGQVLMEREKHRMVALKRHVDSRMWSERMKSLVEGVRSDMEEKEQRRAQAQADERFLAQRRLKPASGESQERMSGLS